MLKFLFCFLLVPVLLFSQSSKSLEVEFSKESKIEVGGNYCGIEFHHSYPAPQRISFYYPVANSIDLLTDYWNRDTSFVSSIKLSIDGKEFDIGKIPSTYRLTPYSVSFINSVNKIEYKVDYRFFNSTCGYLVTYTIKNKDNSSHKIGLDSKYQATLRTCHSYDYMIHPEYRKDACTFVYDQIQTGHSAISFLNAGESPISSSTNELNSKSDSLPCQNFSYLKNLKKNDSIVVKVIVLSSKISNYQKDISYIKNNYKKEVNEFEKNIDNYVKKNEIKTGDEVLDHSIRWAKAILYSNRHYLDGQLLPMPCPAEYNFFFSHDVLVTDLAAINFDKERVKKDLLFIISKASKDYTIPHAYYWQDTSYKTEIAESDNWNHFWFIICSASYLEHTNDISTIKKLSPYLEQSIKLVLSNKKADNLMYAIRPDWWDIGRNYGPRSYMTILCIKSIREYINIEKALNSSKDKINELELTADNMQKSLSEKLWKDDYQYLMNYFEDGSLDTHYYMGSILAAHYNVIDKDKKVKLLAKASQVLLDPKLGIYNVYPMDFHKLISFFKFAGNEAGDPYYYANGGIWQHSNAWYALGLISIDRKDDALNFIKQNMTIKGVMNSPNGQPAMYEYRNGNKADPKIYGEIDKPDFMWAAGWYLYTIYQLFGK